MFLHLVPASRTTAQTSFSAHFSAVEARSRYDVSRFEAIHNLTGIVCVLLTCPFDVSVSLDRFKDVEVCGVHFFHFESELGVRNVRFFSRPRRGFSYDTFACSVCLEESHVILSTVAVRLTDGHVNALSSVCRDLGEFHSHDLISPPFCVPKFISAQHPATSRIPVARILDVGFSQCTMLHDPKPSTIYPSGLRRWRHTTLVGAVR